MPSHSPSTHQSWLIGRAADCDLVVPEPTVSAHHCRLLRKGQQYFLEDLHSPNGVFVNDVRIVAGHTLPIDPTAHITLGRQIAMPWPSEPWQSMRTTLPKPQELRAPARVITIGRAPDSDKQIDLPIVSWNHARILFEGDSAILEDLNSRNGTSIDRIDNRIQRAPLDPTSEVYLGSYKISAAELLGTNRVAVGNTGFDKLEFRGNSMILGRDPQSDLCLDLPEISWRHARLTRAENGILVEDLGSRNGTFIAGMRIGGKALATPGQQIGLGGYHFQLLEGGQLAQRQYHGNLTIEAAGVTVNTPGGTRLLEPVSLTVFPSELVAIMGPSGAGKTTLLKALNGYTKPAEGRVLFNGTSLYDYYDRFRQQISYVPQDDIVHPQLTVAEALHYSARLRTDLTDGEIRNRVQTVLAQLGMVDKQNTRIGSPQHKTLSGGQRKFVNIALELIVDTPVLFLDEPTSGLSSYDAESVIDLLKNLSRQGKTVIITIHQPSRNIFEQFDDLVMLQRDAHANSGAMVYFGPAHPDAIHFFNPAQPDIELAPETLFSGLAQRSASQWQQAYASSRYQRDFVAARSGQQPATPAPVAASKPRRSFGLSQSRFLIQRNLVLKLRDRIQTAILLLQAPLFAALIALIYHPLRATNGFVELTPKLAGVHFLMVVASIWFGCNNAARDIVGEWTIYKRERMVTLKLAAYILSKCAVLAALCLLQCLCLLGIVYPILGLKSNFALDLLVLFIAALIGAGLGLCISAFARTTESAIALLPLFLLPILALGGGIRPTYLIDPNFRWLTGIVPSRWAYEANLLHETEPNAWKRFGELTALEYLPDLSDEQQRPITAIDPKSAEIACQTIAQTNPRPSLLCADAAELSIPAHILTRTATDGSTRTTRAWQGEANAINFRHSFRTSLLVLLSMLAATLLGLLAILLKRDRDPD